MPRIILAILKELHTAHHFLAVLRYPTISLKYPFIQRSNHIGRLSNKSLIFSNL